MLLSTIKRSSIRIVHNNVLFFMFSVLQTYEASRIDDHPLHKKQLMNNTEYDKTYVCKCKSNKRDPP